MHPGGGPVRCLSTSQEAHIRGHGGSFAGQCRDLAFAGLTKLAPRCIGIVGCASPHPCVPELKNTKSPSVEADGPFAFSEPIVPVSRSIDAMWP